MNVSHLETGTFAGQTTGAERRKAAPVGEAGQRVRLVHELAQLAGSEELLDGGDNRPDVDQALRRDCLRVLGSHALPNDSLETGEPDLNLVLDELANGAHAAVGEVVDVVDTVTGGAEPEPNQVADGRQHVRVAEQPVLVGIVGVELDRLATEFQVQLVAADPGEVVTLGVVEQIVDETTCGLDCGELAGTQLAVEVEQRFVLGGRRVLLQRVGDQLGTIKQRQKLFVGLAEAKGTQEGGHVLATLAVDTDTDCVLLVDVEFEPGTAAGNDLGCVDVSVRCLVDGEVEVDAGRANQLADYDTLGAVDDERTVGGHHREVAEEDLLFFDLTGFAVEEAGGNEQRL